MQCMICGEESSEVLGKVEGKIKDTFFDVYKCAKCDAYFVDSSTVNRDIYDKIYGLLENTTYRRYYEYAKNIKNKKNPLKFLADTEISYAPVYTYLKGKKKLNVLEVGSGLGYLTYAIRKAGHNAYGLDISSKVVKLARAQFGDYFINKDLKDIDEKFDLIVIINVIEHIPKPTELIAECKKHLNKGGAIIIITDNRDYHPNKIWITDSPPFHLFWINKKGLKSMAQQNDLSFESINFFKYYRDARNLLVGYIMDRNYVPRPELDKDYNRILVEDKEPIVKRILRVIFIKIKPIRYLCNFLVRVTKESAFLGAVMYLKD